MEATFILETKAIEKTATLEPICAGFLLILLLPLFVLIALLIKLTSRGPVFFETYREGRYGHPYKIKKFRSMRIGTPAVHFRKSLDLRLNEKKRITLMGKLLRRSGFDELPQLINIWRGEMSFVGPRPPAIEISVNNPSYVPRVKGILPGITGWEQTSPKRDIEGYNTHHYDWWYASRRCLLLDLYIIFWRTPHYIFLKKKHW